MADKKSRERMTKKQMIAMVVIIVALLFSYFAFSGTFNTSASYKDILSLSDYEMIASGDDGWEVYVPDKPGLCPYMVCEDDNPRFQVDMMAVLYVGSQRKPYKVDWAPYGKTDISGFFRESENEPCGSFRSVCKHFAN